MKKNILVVIIILSTVNAFGQQKAKQQPPSQKEIQQMMKEMQQAMDGLSAEEKAEMQKIMKGVMTTSATTVPMAVSFNDNKLLVTKKDLQRTGRIPQKAFTDADIVSNALQLYTKLQVKMAPAQKTIVNKILAQGKTADEMNAAAITAVLQGHPQAAMALALKAVQSSPKNPAYQSNLAAILSQSGYPDKAIPYLKKLAAEFPNNSTVLHNLGFAWLQLGETDTAHRFFGAAAIRNPNNPETKICQGVIHELQGDPQKALDAYKEAFELSPNGFTTDLMKNAGDENKWQTVDFEKLKSNITIHEYYSKSWIAVPKLADNVSSFNNDAAIQRGYEEMFEKLTSTLDSLNEGSIQDFTQLADQGLKTFVGTMMAETQKGINVMSKAAAYIDMIMQIYIADWHSRFMQEHLELKMKIDEDRTRMMASKPGERCEAMDRKANAFMEHINPIIRKFHAEKIEELRVWLNAYCTWAPYVVGNPKNLVLNRCLNWTAMLVRMYANAVADQVTIASVCKYQAGDGSTFVPVPEIPSIHCKTAVKMPLGMKDIQLTAETINLNANQWGITKASNTPMPNLTLSFGLNRGLIGEPGKFGRPFVKAGSDGLSFSGHNAGDDEVTPLTKIQDQLTPLDPMLLPEEKRQRIQDMQAKTDAELSKKLLEQFTSKDCNSKPTYITKIGPVSFVEWDAKKGEWVEVPESVSGENDPYILGVSFVEFVDNRSAGKQGEKTFDAITGVSLIEIVDAPSAPVSGKQLKQQQISNTLKSGLQAVISNGLGAASSVTNTIRNLFD